MQQYASAFHFLSAAINFQPKMGELYMLLAGKRHLHGEPPKSAVRESESVSLETSSYVPSVESG